MLTGNTDNMSSILAGIREHRDTIVDILEDDPAAAARLAHAAGLEGSGALGVSSGTCFV